MPNEVYVLVEKKKPLVLVILTNVVLVLALASVVINFMAPVILLVPVLLLIIWWFLKYRTYREFEYTYYDGELKFVCIKNKARRKGLKKLDMEHVVAIAPAGDRSMYRYENGDAGKILDYSSRQADVKVYELVYNNEEGSILIKFEPDDKMLDAICYKYSSKVVR